MVLGHPDNLGSAVWADPDDIAARHPYDPETDIWLGRNPNNFDEAIGYSDDRHVFLCAGTGGGKGRSMVINNLLNWRGSVVSIDPKGENASVCAARRANGDEYCKGLGQKTFVLDPYRLAKVPDELRASCNLMDAIDLSSGSVLSQAEILAEGMRLEQAGGESESWSKDGAEITALVIAHVKTDPMLSDKCRDLVYVRELLTEGLRPSSADADEDFNRQEAKQAKAEGREPNFRVIEDPYETLFTSMLRNPAQKGAIQKRARKMLTLMRTNVRQWGSLIHNSATETNFIDELEMEEQLIPSSQSGRSFRIQDLKDDKDGISVFICLPDDARHPAIRWQKALLALILGNMKRKQGVPETGKQVLMVIDEFASMGKMDDVIHGMTTIRGAGVKLFVIVTSVNRLTKIYENEWKELLSGSSIQMWFQVDDPDTAALIEKAVGEAHIVLFGRSESVAEQKGWSTNSSEAETHGESESEAIGRSEARNSSQSQSRGQSHNMSMSISDSETWNQSQTSGQSETRGTGRSSTQGQGSTWQHTNTFGRNRNQSETSGNSRNHTRDGSGFFDPFIKSTNDGRSRSDTRGSGTNRSTSDAHGGSTNQSSTISSNRSKTLNESNTSGIGGSRGTSLNEGYTDTFSQSATVGRSSTLSKTYTNARNRSNTRTVGRGESGSRTYTRGTQESFHKRPLITYPEMNRYLSRVSVRDHPAYPGFALVRISGEDVFITRKCYYDQDPAFEGLFTPHYAYAENFLPFSKQRLVGGQYTDQHFLPIRLPQALRDAAEKIDVVLELTTDDWFDEDDKLFEWTGPDAFYNRKRFREATEPFPKHRIKNLDTATPYQIEKVTIEERSGPPSRRTHLTWAPADGKVIDFALQPAFEQDGDIMLLRTERVLSDEERSDLEFEFFEQALNYLERKGATQAELDEMVDRLNEEYRREWQAHKERKAEDARLEREAQERARREQEEANRKRREQEKKEAAEARARLVEKERHYLRMGYGSVFGFFLLVIPFLLVIWSSVSVNLNPESLKVLPKDYSRKNYSMVEDGGAFSASDIKPNTVILRFRGQDGEVKSCASPEVVTRWTASNTFVFSCREPTKFEYNRSTSWFWLLFWSFLKGFVVWLPVSVLLQHYASKASQYPENQHMNVQESIHSDGVARVLQKVLTSPITLLALGVSVAALYFFDRAVKLAFNL